MESLYARWESLDALLRTWWDADVRCAQESDLRDPRSNAIWYSDDAHRSREARPGEDEATLLFLPHPYVSAGGSEAAFPEMYCWDSYFINKALLLHDRGDLVRNHLVNHLSMIERFGMVLNGNRTYYRTRSQTPLLAQSIREYVAAEQDRELIHLAYPLLRREYRNYWTAPHHQTPVGLATNRDLGDPHLRPELAAEAESLDFTACYDGDVRKCTPLLLNSALVRFERAMEWFALELGLENEATTWKVIADTRSHRLHELCWDDGQGFYFEYQFERGVRLPYWSLSAYSPLWAGIPTKRQAARLVGHLERFEHPHGLAQTDRAYPSPHPEFTWVQWGYPAGWPPFQMLVVESLQACGYHAEAKRVARKYLTMQIEEFERTGKFWEKYNVVEGTSNLPRERTPNVPLHGWSTAAAVWLGHQALYSETVKVGSDE
jgi:alpha,alpha-trehalase